MNQTSSHPILDEPTLDFVTGKLKALSWEFREKSMQATGPIRDTMSTVAATLQSLGIAFTRLKEEQHALETQPSKEPHEESGHSGEEGEVGEGGELGL